MNREQYHLLLKELAGLSGLPDTAVLLSSGYLGVGERQFQLQLGPGPDSSVLQIHIPLGVIPPDDTYIARSMLQANHGVGRHGDCLFSQDASTGEAILTARLSLRPAPSAQELWQSLSEIAVFASSMWESFIAQPAGKAFGLGRLPA